MIVVAAIHLKDGDGCKRLRTMINFRIDTVIFSGDCVPLVMRSPGNIVHKWEVGAGEQPAGAPWRYRFR